MKRLLAWTASSVAALFAAASFTAAAQSQVSRWPDKPVRVVVPFAAGGSTGAEIVVRANPDGYTLIIVATSYATNAALYKLPYDPVTNITPVGLLHSGPFLLAVNNGVGATSVKDFIELVRAKPSAFNYGSSGIGGASHLATELFKQMTHTQSTHVPYKGDAPAISDLIGGQVQFILSSVPALIQHVKGGKVRALAVTTAQRWPELADLPAVAETVPGYEHTSWNGLWAPAGTPKEIVNRLNQTLAHLLNLPDVQERLRADGRAPAHTSPEEFARIIERDIAKWSKVAKAGNIRVN